jgi:SAM-dependent methyltransferase
MWTAAEQAALEPVLASLIGRLGPLVGQRILVLCSADGEVALRLARGVRGGEVVGLELSDELLAAAVARAATEPGVPVRFAKAVVDRIPLPDAGFDAVVSEFIVHPTPKPTQIGQPEMARVLRAGGKMVVTDVIAPDEPPPAVRAALAGAGLDYLCVATPEDFVEWMEAAALEEVEVRDVTPLVRPVWESRLRADVYRAAANHLLGSGPWALGRGLRYVEVEGRKR